MIMIRLLLGSDLVQRQACIRCSWSTDCHECIDCPHSNNCDHFLRCPWICELQASDLQLGHWLKDCNQHGYNFIWLINVSLFSTLLSIMCCTCVILLSWCFLAQKQFEVVLWRIGKRYFLNKGNILIEQKQKHFWVYKHCLKIVRNRMVNSSLIEIFDE